MELPETASPDIFRVEGPHHVARNFGNTFWHKFRQHFQKLDFSSRFLAKIDIFDFSVWQGRGCAWAEISFWCDPHRLGVKPHGRPKSRTRPPRGVTNIFSSPSMGFGSYFQKCHLNADVETDSYPIPSKNYKFDIIIDISLLQRAGLTRIDKRFTDKVNAGKVLTIRSSFSKKEPRLIKSAKPISYKIPKEDHPKSMVYFLQNIFWDQYMHLFAKNFRPLFEPSFLQQKKTISENRFS